MNTFGNVFNYLASNPSMGLRPIYLPILPWKEKLAKITYSLYFFVLELHVTENVTRFHMWKAAPAIQDSDGE